jgi:hypothetical protein
VLVLALERQAGLEAGAGAGTSVLTVTEPTETAVSAAFAHTAVLAGRPGNAEALAETGRMFGRIAHLVDAVEDLADDKAGGAWNPLAATGTSLQEARRLCDDAHLGLRLAVRDVEFGDRRLAHALLVHEVEHAITRTFTAAHPGPGGPRPGPGPGPDWPPGPPPPPPLPPPGPNRRITVPTCFAALGMCLTCQFCCEYTSPCDGRRKEGWCSRCGHDGCGDACDCGCDSCDCADCCCDACDCGC